MHVFQCAFYMKQSRMDASLDQFLVFSLSTKTSVRALKEFKNNLGTEAVICYCHRTGSPKQMPRVLLGSFSQFVIAYGLVHCTTCQLMQREVIETCRFQMAKWEAIRKHFMCLYLFPEVSWTQKAARVDIKQAAVWAAGERLLLCFISTKWQDHQRDDAHLSNKLKYNWVPSAAIYFLCTILNSAWVLIFVYAIRIHCHSLFFKLCSSVVALLLRLGDAQGMPNKEGGWVVSTA